MWGHWIILGYSNIINSLNIVTQMEDAMPKRADHENCGTKVYVNNGFYYPLVPITGIIVSM